MTFQPDSGSIRWRVHLRSSPAKVYDALATDEGRALYWAERTVESHGVVTFHFSGHPPVSGPVLLDDPPHRFALEYFGARVEFTLDPDGSGGTDLSLHTTGVAAVEHCEVVAGWVSVLMAMKAAIDHGVDLRNHDPARSWATGFLDN